MFSKAVKSALQPSLSAERTLVMAAVSGGLAVVDVTNGADVYVRLGAIELLLGHCHPPFGIDLVWPFPASVLPIYMP